MLGRLFLLQTPVSNISHAMSFSIAEKSTFLSSAWLGKLESPLTSNVPIELEWGRGGGGPEAKRKASKKENKT